MDINEPIYYYTFKCKGLLCRFSAKLSVDDVMNIEGIDVGVPPEEKASPCPECGSDGSLKRVKVV